MKDDYKEIFVPRFRDNLVARGVLNPVPPQCIGEPRPLPRLLSGPALEDRLMNNVNTLIAGVLVELTEHSEEVTYMLQVTPELLVQFCDECFDAITSCVVDPKLYFAEYMAACVKHAEYCRNTELRIREPNPRHRLWIDPRGTPCGPDFLQIKMDAFFAKLAVKIRRETDIALERNDHYFPSLRVCAEIMAFVDVTLQGSLFPWIDCGDAIATSLIMWLAGGWGLMPPVFGDKHDATINDVRNHAEYLLGLLNAANPLLASEPLSTR